MHVSSAKGGSPHSRSPIASNIDCPYSAAYLLLALPSSFCHNTRRVGMLSIVSKAKVGGHQSRCKHHRIPLDWGLQSKLTLRPGATDQGEAHCCMRQCCIHICVADKTATVIVKNASNVRLCLCVQGIRQRTWRPHFHRVHAHSVPFPEAWRAFVPTACAHLLGSFLDNTPVAAITIAEDIVHIALLPAPYDATLPSKEEAVSRVPRPVPTR